MQTYLKRSLPAIVSRLSEHFRTPCFFLVGVRLPFLNPPTGLLLREVAAVGCSWMPWPLLSRASFRSPSFWDWLRPTRVRRAPMWGRAAVGPFGILLGWHWDALGGGGCVWWPWSLVHFFHLGRTLTDLSS